VPGFIGGLREGFTHETLSSKEAAMGANQQGKILLVEDERKLRALIAEFLGGEGFEIVQAADGREAVEHFHGRGPFDLVLLDLNLPILTGVEVCRLIKSDRPEQPIVVCSAAVLDADMEALRALGVEQFLSKPYHPAELVRRITGELRKPADRRGVLASGLESAGWWLDRPSPLSGPSQALVKQPMID
jgi:DNA-binding response OmpR family regulator